MGSINKVILICRGNQTNKSKQTKNWPKVAPGLKTKNSVSYLKCKYTRNVGVPRTQWRGALEAKFASPCTHLYDLAFATTTVIFLT